MTDQLAELFKALEKNRIKPYFVETKEEVVPLVAGMLEKGNTVTLGGSRTLFETGVVELLRSGEYCFLDRYALDLSPEEIEDLYARGKKADVFFCSSNALTMNGELYNVDGNSNRVSSIVHGPKKVIVIVGINKLVTNLEEAVLRVKTIAAPQVCKGRGVKTYCTEKGVCKAQNSGLPGMTEGCSSPERSCCNYLVSGPQRVPNRLRLILVNEALGF